MAEPYSKESAATAADTEASGPTAARPSPMEAQSSVQGEHRITVSADRREERAELAASITRPQAPIRVFQKRDVLEWAVIIIIGIISFIVNELVAPHNKIVREGDEELSYPLVAAETVSTELAAAIGLLIPLFVIFVSSEVTVRDRRELHVQMQMLVQALAFAFIYTTLLKKYLGRPRPNFFAMCEWVPGQGCTSDKAHDWEARQSFPSGHSSHSFAGLGFLTLYLLDKVYRLHQLRHVAPLSLMQFLAMVPISVAAWIAASRVWDYFHNYDDVVTGSVLGMACAWQAFGQGKRMLEVDREKYGLVSPRARGEEAGERDVTDVLIREEDA
mmetsp:Transcript_10937/g.26800  ORF Transcript_10937/g.26800 Transcript_10937/m.26800 type:complete len:330 (-) Transcript_10937:19-1008(-)